MPDKTDVACDFALSGFKTKHPGKLKGPISKEDAQVVINLAHDLERAKEFIAAIQNLCAGDRHNNKLIYSKKDGE